MPTWQNLIDRAKVYIADDNDQESNFIKPDKWLILGNVELQLLRSYWARMGLINPATVDQTFSGSTVTVVNALALVGVAEILSPSTPYRVLQESQSAFGATPYWNTQPGSHSSTWAATGFGDTFAVTLDPPTAGNYVVRYAPNLAYATDPQTSPELPTLADERLVLGMARRAHIKDSGRSATIEQLIMQQDAALAFVALGRLRNDGPRVRRVEPRARAKAALSSMPNDSRFWRYF